MNTGVLSFLCTCVLTSYLVTSTPVYPNMPLKHFSVTDICLFMCNICFDNMDAEMMQCASNVCMAEQQYDMNLGLLKLGRTCKNYSKLDAFMFGKASE